MQTLFEKLSEKHLNTVMIWLGSEHVREFWDNSDEHKQDIIKFSQGRVQASSYADGQYFYWIANTHNEKSELEPFAMLMTIQETVSSDINIEKINRLSVTGNTYQVEYMIGNKDLLGKGYGARTLLEFIDYFRSDIDPKADTFFVDPSVDNSKAKNVYEKAGFEYVCDFVMQDGVSSRGKKHHLLVKKFEPTIKIIEATVDDYPTIQNLARFYAYDLSRWCACISDNWDFPDNGLYESFDTKIYFEDKTRKSHLIRVYNEIAGFVLINKNTLQPETDWDMGEFFITAKFQGTGVARRVAHSLFSMYKGQWEVCVIPQNLPAHIFWERTISEFNINFTKSVMKVDFDIHQTKRIVFTFRSE